MTSVSKLHNLFTALFADMLIDFVAVNPAYDPGDLTRYDLEISFLIFTWYFYRYFPCASFFSPLGKPADRAIYFACVNFFLFYKLSKAISWSTGPIFTIFSPNGRYLCECWLSGPFFPILQGTLPWQPILCTKKNTNHARFLQFLHHMKAFLV